MRKLIAILICISTLAFLSCGDNSGGGKRKLRGGDRPTR